MSPPDVSDREVWRPSPERARASLVHAFISSADEMTARSLVGYQDLHDWSVNDPEGFWALVWQRCGVVGERGDRVIEPGTTMAGTRFFPEARLNVVDNLLGRTGPEPAVIAIDETGRRQSRSWDELRTNAASIAGALTELGVGPGDRVAAWLPNGIEAIEAMLGAAWIGAVFSSASPDFGSSALVDRFGQIEPTVMFATDGYHYGGRRFDCLERLADVRAGLPTLRHVVVVRTGDAPAPSGLIDYDELLRRGGATVRAPERLPFDHPWYVMFSSGTTGVPKCIVHRAGGALIQHLKEHQLHCDLRDGDRMLFFTTTGWMMWNWMVSALASGTTVVAYDGSPFHPDPLSLFRLVEQERITLLGLGAKLIDTLRNDRIRPKESVDLSSLRTVCSTGSPLSPEGFAHVYEAVADDVHLASISGGTDLLGCFVLGDPTSPVHAGAIQRPGLGMAVDVLDESGVSLRDHPGAAGELVCTAPFPSMPLGFWSDGSPGLPDPDRPGPRFVSSYFARDPNTWVHGDFASWTAHGGMVIHGRSDATLNPGGVRIGTAEIYRAVEQIEAVVESLVFGQEWGGDTRIVLLVRLAEGHTLDDRLIADIRAKVRTTCSPRHVPAIVAQVDDLPRTRSNKLVELAVADAVNGRPVRNTDAIANPDAIDAIVAHPALARSRSSRR